MTANHKRHAHCTVVQSYEMQACSLKTREGIASTADCGFSVGKYMHISIFYRTFIYLETHEKTKRELEEIFSRKLMTGITVIKDNPKSLKKLKNVDEPIAFDQPRHCMQ